MSDESPTDGTPATTPVPVPAHSSAHGVDQLLAAGLPPIPGPRDDDLRWQAENLAMALVAAIAADDPGAREAFLDRLFEVQPDGAGVIFAVEHLTAVRLAGIPEGGLNPHAIVAPDADQRMARKQNTQQEREHYIACLDIVINIWTGRASGNEVRYIHGMSAVRGGSVADIRAVLTLMATEIAVMFNRFEGWRTDGDDHLRDYRCAHPRLTQ